ncbi:MAG: S8 family peptidase, partial [Gammaproteobacteria bacterium]|nr:S8 family peptidase [Gammaproteobacteria bacterium]
MTMAQLDPELRKLLVREAKQPGTLEQISEPLRVFLKFQGDLAPLEALGFKPQTVRGNIATGRLPASRLPEISKHPNALKMQLSRKLHEDLDQSITEVRANTVRSVDASGTWSGLATGRGVIVGVIDSGINFKHQSFRNADGTTRILAIWDQSSSAGATPTDHAGSFGTYDYGSVYDQNEINAALRESNPVPIPHKDRSSGHGTHVTGIAAGNGRQDDRCHDPHDFNGVAPEADLVIIKISTEDEALGEDMHLADAISFINDLADAQTPPQPVVINLSQGDNLGPHDGTSLVEQLIDLEYGSLSPGKALVKSAGNEGASNRHAEGTVPSAGQLDIEFTVKSGDKKTRLLELWYPGEDPVLGENLLRCQVVTPDGSVTSPSVTPGDLENFHPQGDTEVTITSDTNDIDNGDKRIRIELDPEGGKLPSGQWKVRLSNSGALGVPVHCWIERGTGGPTFTDSSRDTTLSIPGTARHAVVVGNYIYKGDNAGERTRSSSRGPTRDGGRPVNEQKPDLSAPGTKVMSARAHDLPCCEAFWCCCRERHHHDKTGTSMAAPHVAGAIALMFELHPELEATEVIEVLRETARSDGFTGGVPNDRWGAGKLDVRAAADEAL